MTAVAAPKTAPSTTRPSIRQVLAHPAVGGTIGIVLLLVIWWLVATVFPSSSIIPTPGAVVVNIAHNGPSYYLPNIAATLGRAAWGYLFGNLAALILAALVLLVPRAEEIVTQLGVVSQCIPVTAIGPILLLVWGSDTATIVLASMLVFFPTMVGTIYGLRSATQTTLDMVTAFGGSAFTRIRKVQLIAAIPSVFTALKIAVPSAILGAVVGEYLGGGDTGIGVALEAAQRNSSPERVWAMSVLAGLIALLGYGIVEVIGRLVAPWSRTRKADR